MAPPAPATVDELGLQGCLYLWALLTGQQRRLPIAPTKRMTLVILALLQDQGVIEVPWPQVRWEFKPDAHTTPIEGLQWRLAWTVYEPGRLLEALDDYFDTLEQTDFTIAVGLRLWSDLAPAEAEHYFEQQLVKHRFAADWAQDLAFAYREGPGAQLNIAQWRYCAWAAVRRGASVAMQNGLQADGLRDSIYQELKRRAASVASGTWSNCSFAPTNSLPENALGRALVHHASGLDSFYWTSRPCEEILLCHARAKAQRLSVF